MSHPLLFLEPDRLLSRCKIEKIQSSGPGGQKRNRVYSAVRLSLEMDGKKYQGVSSEERSVQKNQEKALQNLRLELALQIPREKPEEGMDPARFRIQSSLNHFDFPITVFIFLCILDENKGDMEATALKLGVSKTALTRFLKRNKKVRDRCLELLKIYGKSGYNHYL